MFMSIHNTHIVLYIYYLYFSEYNENRWLTVQEIITNISIRVYCNDAVMKNISKINLQLNY